MQRLLLVLLAAMAASCGAQSESIKVPTTVWAPIGSWSGKTSMQSETFVIDAHEWRLYWETRNETAPNAGALAVFLHSGDSGRILATPVRRTGVGKGMVLVTEPPRPNFYLSFEASNVEWSVRIEEPIKAERGVPR